VNLLDAEFGRPWLRGWRRWRLKEWEHVAFMHPHVYMSIAVVDVKFLATSWVFIHDRRTGRSIEHVRKLRAKALTLPDQLWDGSFEFAATGYRIKGHNHLAEGCHRISIEIEPSRDAPEVRANLTMRQDLEQVPPLISVLPLGPNRPFYTHKAPIPLEGSLTVDQETFTYQPRRDLALLDVHKAFYPRRTFWKWATFATFDARGKLLALNLSHNVIPDDEANNENRIWHANSLSSVGPARFEVPANPTDVWRIRTVDDRVDLRLTPQGVRHESINLLFARSGYDQPFGEYEGFVVDDEGRRHEVANVFGLAEDHLVTW